jgi:hypothetical protein
LGDSIYDGRIFVGGAIAALGHDAVIEEMTDDDRAFLQATLADVGIPMDREYQKVVSGKQLYNFDKRDFARWRNAL